MKNSESASGGVGFGGLLCIAFIVLKLCGVINWSWWWVTSPLWIPLAIVLSGLCIYFICKLPSAYVERKRKIGIQKLMRDKGYGWYAASMEYSKKERQLVKR